MRVSEIVALLSKLAPPLVSAIAELVRVVISSDDPLRTAERHAKMIAARQVSRDALRRLLS